MINPGTQILLSAAVMAGIALAAIPARAALVAHWKLDETSGSTAADSVGANNTGVITGSTTWVSGANAKIGGALDFTGGATNGAVTAPLTQIPTGNSARTISLWFNADTVSTTGMKIFGYGDGTATTGTGGVDSNPYGDAFAFTVEDNGLVYFRYSGGNRRFNLAGNTNLSADTWYHFAAVVPDGASTTNDVQVYLNGVAANQTLGGTSQPLTTDPTPTIPDFYLGHDGATTIYFEGTLDDVQLYNTALNASEISSLYNNPGSVIADNVAPTPPNVLFVVFDDLNTWIEPMGEYPDVQTPNMNRLAARGVTFTRAYCQAPICGPSRLSFLSGLRPSTTGKYALNSLLYNDASYGSGSHKAIHRFYKDAGYTTASVGKIYHQAVEFGSSLDHGDGVHDYGPLPANKLTSAAVSGSSRLIDWGVYPPTDGETRDYKSATWALARIKDFAANPVKPFFLSVGIVRPHLPLFVPQHWFDLYPVSPSRSFARPFYEPDDLDDTTRFARYTHWNVSAPRTETLIQYNQWDAHTRAYLACVTNADAMFGRLLDGLEDPNGDSNTNDSITDNTIVVMFSDHGYHLGEKGLTAKCTLWDRATRVPLIIAGPDLATGGACSQPVELLDLYPTLLDLCGIGPYAPLEGISLRPQLEHPLTAPARQPALISHGPNNHAVVDERYCYIRYADGSEELYDHAIDPNEKSNRIHDPNFREVATRLAASIPAVSAPYRAGETSRLLSIEAGAVVHWEASPINDSEAPAPNNPVVATFVSPVADEEAVDLDEDGMPDWWEIHYTDSTGVLGLGGNKDGDPVSDADEYLQGTDPTDPHSFLWVKIEPDAAGGGTITHSTVPGRNYRLQISPALSGWTAVGVPSPGSGSHVTRGSGSLGLSVNQGFIRVEVSSEADAAP